MKRAPVAIAVLVASAAAVVALTGLPWPARLYAVFLMVPLVAVSALQVRALASFGGELPRTAVYLSSGISLWILAALAIVVADASGFTPELIGIAALRADLLVAWTVFCIAAAAMLAAFGKALDLSESPLLLQLLPVALKEKLIFALLSITAGITEEVVFRGFLIAALTFAIGNTWVAAAVASIAFGALHGYQSFTGASRAAVLGFALAVPFVMTGSLLPGIVAHALIDIIGGLWLVERLNQAH